MSRTRTQLHLRTRRLAVAVLFSFVAGIVSFTAGEVLRSPGQDIRGAHFDGAPCSDPADDGHACGPACVCTCCPGHTTGLAFVTPGFSLGSWPAIEIAIGADNGLRSKDILRRIFHPPRV